MYAYAYCVYRRAHNIAIASHVESEPMHKISNGVLSWHYSSVNTIPLITKPVSVSVHPPPSPPKHPPISPIKSLSPELSWNLASAPLPSKISSISAPVVPKSEAVPSAVPSSLPGWGLCDPDPPPRLRHERWLSDWLCPFRPAFSPLAFSLVLSPRQSLARPSSVTSALYCQGVRVLTKHQAAVCLGRRRWRTRLGAARWSQRTAVRRVRGLP